MPKPRIVIELSQEEKNEIKSRSAKEGKSIKGKILELVRAWIDKEIINGR